MDQIHSHLKVLSLAFLWFTILLLNGCGTSGPVTDPDPLTIDYLMTLSDEELMERDSDGDQLTDYDEIFVYETDPLNSDTDGDGLTDYEEVFIQGTDPLMLDTDKDGISDGDEVNVYETDPLSPDSDNDGLSDCQELIHTKRGECENPSYSGEYDGGYRTDPLNPDTDEDALSDCREVLHTNALECVSTDFNGPYDGGYGTDPLNPDTDSDGFSDGQEIEMNTLPLDPTDPPYISADELTTVHFEFDKSSVTEGAAQKLSQNIELLMEMANVHIRIDAYTDHVGGDQYNMRLSVRRANSVADFYSNNGIGDDRIDLRGLGKAPVPCTRQEMDRDTPGCKKNRRAETHLINPHSLIPMY